MTPRGGFPWLVGVCLFCSGCMATHEPPGLDPAEQQRVADAALPRLVIGVREPSLALPQADFWNGTGARQIKASLHRVRSLITDLRATGLFESVDLVEKLEREPDLTLVALEPIERSSSDASVVATLLVCFATAAVIPAVLTKQHGYRFARSDALDAALEFDWMSTYVWGWVALPMMALPGWAADGPPDGPPDADPSAAKRSARFALFLIEHRDEIWGSAPAP